MDAGKTPFADGDGLHADQAVNHPDAHRAKHARPAGAKRAKALSSAIIKTNKKIRLIKFKQSAKPLGGDHYGGAL